MPLATTTSLTRLAKRALATVVSVAACASLFATSASASTLFQRDVSFEFARAAGNFTDLDARLTLPVAQGVTGKGTGWAAYVGGAIEVDGAADFFDPDRYEWQTGLQSLFIGAELLPTTDTVLQARASIEKDLIEKRAKLDLRYARTTANWSTDITGSLTRFATDPNGFRLGDRGLRTAVNADFTYYGFKRLPDDAELFLSVRGERELAVTNPEEFIAPFPSPATLTTEARFTSSFGKRTDFLYPGRVSLKLLADINGRREATARVNYTFLRGEKVEFRAQGDYSYRKSGGSFSRLDSDAKATATLSFRPNSKLDFDIEPWLRREFTARSQTVGVSGRANWWLSQRFSLAFTAELARTSSDAGRFNRQFAEMRAVWQNNSFTGELYASREQDRYVDQWQLGSTVRFDHFFANGNSVFSELSAVRTAQAGFDADWQVDVRAGLRF